MEGTLNYAKTIGLMLVVTFVTGTLLKVLLL